MYSGTYRARSGRSAVWIPAGGITNVQGHCVPGLVYIGSQFNDDYGRHGVIDLTLPVKGGTGPSSLPYYPSYDRISPAARAHFLAFLINGRDDPNIDIGYVFMYFYGLERRLMKDRADAAAIATEVKRLLDCYGANGSFRFYATQLLECADLLLGDVSSPKPLQPPYRRGRELPLTLRLRLGKLIAARGSLEAQDALAWYQLSPLFGRCKPAQNSSQEFEALFAIRFSAKWPKGLRIAEPKRRLKASYRAASGNFTVDLPTPDLPEISELTAPLKRIEEIAQTCADDLGPYSRFVGRDPAAKVSLAAVVLLPKELRNTSAGAALTAAENALRSKLQGERAMIATRELCCMLSLPFTGDRLPALTDNVIATVLDTLDIGFEPDRRTGGVGIGVSTQLALFASSGGGRGFAPSAEFAKARTMLAIAVLAAHADGKIDPAELISISSNPKIIRGLSPTEHTRLQAYLEAMLACPPKLKSALTRLSKLDNEARMSALNVAIEAVQADGQVTHGEVIFVERVTKALGMKSENAHAMLHRRIAPTDAPVTVLPEVPKQGISIPSPRPAALGSHIQIDAKLVDSLRRDTTEVAALMASILNHDEPLPSAQAPKDLGTSVFKGLDSAHASLLEALVTGALADRQAFDDAARRHRLLPEGAIETINDWGFEQFQEAALEDDGPSINVPTHLLQTLREMRANG